jgi:hypothetical protein
MRAQSSPWVGVAHAGRGTDAHDPTSVDADAAPGRDLRSVNAGKRNVRFKVANSFLLSAQFGPAARRS